ncbi:PAS domain-containing protein [Ensifer adhaerens]|uniref:PAS domain-containing protein n=1 Tax=Ensifer adhaerens TaxID=106592 RepID=UPI001F3204AF|nr:PAS domain S-box protein [Ensifer adhaerens]MDF8357565.1 PAS domain S-box protein [Ensifer adhaerens]
MKFESALQASEERLRAIFSQSAAGIVHSDLTGRILLVDNRFCEILGYSESELLSMQMRDISVAGDIAEADRLFETMAERVQTFEMETRLLRKDGGFQQVTCHHRRHYRTQARAGLRATPGRDHRFVQRCRPWHDLGMKITSWNTDAERLYGYAADEVIGRSFLVLVPEDRQGEEPAILRQVSAGLKVEPYETARLHKIGQSVDVLLSVSPICDAYGAIVSASKLAHDISARKDAERLQSVLVGELNLRAKNFLRLSLRSRAKRMATAK